jgi:predicted nucleic-acid-binding protein
MIAFDTNLLVRALVMDNPERVAIARRLMAEDTVFLSRTVLLEAEWVLRSRYNKSRTELLAFFRALLETENTVVETAEAIGHAVEWYAQGADFADALHLAACGPCVMHTFDPDFCKAAREAGIAPAVHVWEV